MNIGTIIKKMRKSRDMTQEELAEFLDISAQAVSAYKFRGNPVNACFRQ